MYGPDSSVLAVPTGGPIQQQLSRPRPEQRVVEDTARATLEQQRTDASPRREVVEMERLSESARRFAAILDTTGDVRMASSATGFRVGHLDLYA